MLLIGDRVVLRASAPPEAEYALFETSEIELRASEPGRVREHGYHTTVKVARARLAQAGITEAFARECAVTMHPVLSEAFARGPSVRHVACYLGPLELFQSESYNGSTQSYRGVFLELAALVASLRLPGASAALQALYLAALLEHERDDTTVFLSTDAFTKQKKPGLRTHKRISLVAARDLPLALGELARTQPMPQIREHLPRADVIAFIRSQMESAPDEDARALYAGLERKVSTREMPDRGPLADPVLWSLETRLDAGNTDGVIESVDEIERLHGRSPGTTYLRARASLALRLESPKLVAERVSALALSMSSFQELLLLASEAWLEAGESRRAMPYARDLVDASTIDEGLYLRAQRVLARAVGAAPETHATLVDSLPAAPLPPSQWPPERGVMLEPETPQPFHPTQRRAPTAQGIELERHTTDAGIGGPPVTQSVQPRPSLTPVPQPPSIPAVLPPPPPARSHPPAQTSHRPISFAPDLEPPTPRRSAGPIELEMPPIESAAASFTLDLPNPEPPPPPPPPVQDRRNAPTLKRPFATMPTTPSVPSMPRTVSEKPRQVSEKPKQPSDRPRQGSDKPRQLSDKPRTASDPHRRRITGVRVETRAPPKYDPRAEPESENLRAQRIPSEYSSDVHERSTPLRPPTSRPPAASSPQADVSGPGRGEPNLLQGASLPPFAVEDPPPPLPKAPLFPRLPADEFAERLSLPPGVGAELLPRGKLPSSVFDARVQFTMLARELGSDYRRRRGIELRTDTTGIEAMQSFLWERFPVHVVRNSDDAMEIRRHGALLSEILARRLDAEWVDISNDEVGRWAMIVPPDTRVWPFGRVARLVQMGHRERDLVSYFLELQSRAHGRR